MIGSKERQKEMVSTLGATETDMKESGEIVRNTAKGSNNLLTVISTQECLAKENHTVKAFIIGQMVINTKENSILD